MARVGCARGHRRRFPARDRRRRAGQRTAVTAGLVGGIIAGPVLGLAAGVACWSAELVKWILDAPDYVAVAVVAGIVGGIAWPMLELGRRVRRRILAVVLITAVPAIDAARSAPRLLYPDETLAVEAATADAPRAVRRRSPATLPACSGVAGEHATACTPRPPRERSSAPCPACRRSFARHAADAAFAGERGVVADPQDGLEHGLVRIRQLHRASAAVQDRSNHAEGCRPIQRRRGRRLAHVK